MRIAEYLIHQGPSKVCAGQCVYFSPRDPGCSFDKRRIGLALAPSLVDMNNLARAAANSTRGC